MAERRKKDNNSKESIDLDRAIGPNVRRWREQRGLSQEELAEAADIHRTQVGLVERGEREPGAGNIARLAGALGIPPGALFEGFEFIPGRPGAGSFSYEMPEPDPSED